MFALSTLGWGVVVFSVLALVCAAFMWRSHRAMQRLDENSIEYALHKHFNYWVMWVLILNIFMVILMLKGIYIDPYRHDVIYLRYL